MVKYKKIYLIILFYLFINLFNWSSAENKDLNFLSLKNNEVNLRQGPSFEYPIKLVYKKKYLPVKIVDKTKTWRQIRDLENNSGWIHVSQLSKKKTGINIKKNSLIYKNPTIYSKPIARLEYGRLVLINKCKKNWCKIKSGNFKGWIIKDYLWGKIQSKS